MTSAQQPRRSRLFLLSVCVDQPVKPHSLALSICVEKFDSAERGCGPNEKHDTGH